MDPASVRCVATRLPASAIWRTDFPSHSINGSWQNLTANGNSQGQCEEATEDPNPHEDQDQANTADTMTLQGITTALENENHQAKTAYWQSFDGCHLHLSLAAAQTEWIEVEGDDWSMDNGLDDENMDTTGLHRRESTLYDSDSDDYLFHAEQEEMIAKQEYWESFQAPGSNHHRQEQHNEGCKNLLTFFNSTRRPRSSPEAA